MHLVLTKGKNPVFQEEVDDYDSLKNKLCNLKKIEPDSSFSSFAKHLFSRLTAV